MGVAGLTNDRCNHTFMGQDHMILFYCQNVFLIIVTVCRAPFDGPCLATANSGGVTLYQPSNSNLNLMAGLNQQDISLSLDWTLHKYVFIAIV